MIKEERHPIHKNKIIWCTYSDNHRKILDSAEIRSYDFFEFLVIKISEYFRCNPDLLISLTDTYVKLKNLEKKFPGVVEEILSKNMLDISRLTEVLLSFIRERICIKDFKEVLELVALHCSEVRNNSEGDEHKLEMQKLVNFARINKRRSLLQNFITEDKTLKTILFEGETDKVNTLTNTYLEHQENSLQQTVVLCDDQARSELSSSVLKSGLSIPIFSYSELDPLFFIERVN